MNLTYPRCSEWILPSVVYYSWSISLLVIIHLSLPAPSPARGSAAEDGGLSVVGNHQIAPLGDLSLYW